MLLYRQNYYLKPFGRMMYYLQWDIDWGFLMGANSPINFLGQKQNGLVVRNANIFPEEPLLAKEDWLKIVDYYLDNAPDSLLTSKNHRKR